MRVIEHTADMQKLSAALTAGGKRIVLVPTMGYLHRGHTSLFELARQHGDMVVASIFVNPTQFGPGEDYQDYPRDFESDRKVCEAYGVDVVFAPSVAEMYPQDFSTWVEEYSLSRELCGALRPGHFRGVITVVSKLFNAVRPYAAVFGRKDAQQALVIKRMTRDLNFGVDIIVGPIIRDDDGLAVSSRNEYLSAEEREAALAVPRGLNKAYTLFEDGERRADVLCETVSEEINDAGGQIDYVQVVSKATLEEVTSINEPGLLAVAAWFGKARLIDNVYLDP